MLRQCAAFSPTAAACLALICCGCDDSQKQPQAEDVPIPLAPSAPGANARPGNQAARRPAGPYDKQFDGIRFTVPAGWKEVELTARQQGFIDARFLVPADGTELQLTCSSTGGGIEANVDRWIGQFRLPPGDKPDVDTILIDGTKATWVDLRGTYEPGMIGSAGPQQNQRMLGVAVPNTPRDFYLKLLGPREAVAEVYDEFREFARSGRLTDD